MARRRGIVSNRARWMNRRQTAASRRGDSSQKSVLVLADLCWSVFPDSLHAGSASLRPDRACGLCFAQVSADGLPSNEVRIACDRIAGNHAALPKPHVIELPPSQPEVDQSVGPVGFIGIEFGQHPGPLGLQRMTPPDQTPK